MPLGTFGDTPQFLPGNVATVAGSIVQGGSASVNAVAGQSLTGVSPNVSPRTVASTGVAAGEVAQLGGPAIHNLPDGKLAAFNVNV